MAETRQLIFEVEFNPEAGIEKAAKLRQAIDEDKKALAELNAEIKKNGSANDEQAKTREKLEKLIKDANKERATELKMVDNYLKATQGVTNAQGEYIGSINNLRANLGFLTEKWNNLTKEERENVAIGGKLQQELKKTSDELKSLEGSVGDNRRSVGGYLDAIRQAPGAMGKMRAGIDGIGLALKSNPFGLIVSLLPQIAALFNTSGEGADFFAKVMQQINAVVEVGMKYLVRFANYAVDAGKAAFTAFSSPKKLLTDLVDFMKTNLINRFKAFAVILEGIKTMDFRKVTDGVIQMGTGITDATSKAQNLVNKAGKGFQQLGKDISDAANAGGDLADRMDALENAESRFAAASSKTRLEIQQLIAQSKNRSLTEKERIALLDKADKKEVDLNKRAIRLAEERMKLIKEENRIKQGDEDEEIKRENEQQEKINELRGQSLVLQERLQARKDAILAAAAEREKKRLEDLAKAEKEYEEKRAKALKATEDFQAELEKIKQDKAKEIETARKLALEKQFEANEKVRKQAEKDDEARRKQEEIDTNNAIALKKKEHDALVNLSDATSALFAALAEESSTFAEFQKALTLFKIGLASAEAITKGIAASQDMPFPGNLIAMATTVATVGTNLLQAKKLIDGDIPKAPKNNSKFADGTILDGPSHAEGGIQIYGKNGYHYGEAEGGEPILTAGVSKNPALLAIASMINQAAGGKPLTNTRYAAVGGIMGQALPTTTRNYINNTGTPAIDYNQLARAMAKMPAPVVSVKRIESVQAQHQVTVKRSTIG